MYIAVSSGPLNTEVRRPARQSYFWGLYGVTGNAPVSLSITHKFVGEGYAQSDVSETGHSAPHNDVAGWRIVGSGQVASEFGEFGDVGGKYLSPWDSRSTRLSPVGQAGVVPGW
jgi:hypothetical protein